MAQTTGALSAKDAYVEASIDQAAAVDISGYANLVDPGDAGRDVGDAYTFDGDTGIVTAGKRTPLDVKGQFVYEEGGSGAFDTLKTAFEAGSEVQINWAPGGNTVGNYMCSMAVGRLSAFNYPKVDASDPAPIMCGFTVHTPSISVAAITT